MLIRKVLHLSTDMFSIDSTYLTGDPLDLNAESDCDLGERQREKWRRKKTWCTHGNVRTQRRSGGSEWNAHQDAVVRAKQSRK